jgi:hypothetical protein
MDLPNHISRILLVWPPQPPESRPQERQNGWNSSTFDDGGKTFQAFFVNFVPITYTHALDPREDKQ